MPANHLLIKLGPELIYSLVIFVLCLVIYIRTKEIYDLTKHKGIQFFRHSFLFFGLAYASRLILYFTMISNGTGPGVMRQLKSIIPVSNLVVAYFSTMAILYLTYSIIHKKIDVEHFITFSNIIALIVAVVAFVSRSPLIISLIQLLLFLVIFVILIKNHQKKKSSTLTLYLFIALFWFLNLFALVPTKRLNFAPNLLFQIISIGLFVMIYYKVAKWIK